MSNLQRLVEKYKDLRQSGHTEEQAINEAKDFVEFSDIGQFVTTKDLKIFLFEFAEKYKLEALNLKVNIILWAVPFIFGTLGFVIKLLMTDIIPNLPK